MLDKIYSLVRECKKLQKENKMGCNDMKIDEIYDTLHHLLSKCNEKIIVKKYSEKEIAIKNYGDFERVIDELVDFNMDIKEILVNDFIEENNIKSNSYWDTTKVMIEDKTGKNINTLYF